MEVIKTNKTKFNNLRRFKEAKQEIYTVSLECKDMCPQEEFQMRVKNNLINTLEKFVIK